MIRTSASSSAAIVADADHLPLGVVGQHHQPPGRRDQRPVGRPPPSGSGVVKPVRGRHPVHAQEEQVDVSARIAASATGPTSASDGVRMPPVSTTVWSARRRW